MHERRSKDSKLRRPWINNDLGEIEPARPRAPKFSRPQDETQALGFESEKRVAEALQFLKDEGDIKGFYWSIKYAELGTVLKIDFLVFIQDQTIVPLQSKSSEFGGKSTDALRVGLFYSKLNSRRRWIYFSSGGEIVAFARTFFERKD